MTPAEAVRKVGRGLRRASELLSPKRRQERIEELTQIIQEAQLAQELLASPAWTELVNPWLCDVLKENDYDFHNCKRQYSDDTPLHYQRGKTHLVVELRAMLKGAVNLKPLAEEELKALRARSQKGGNRERT
jgi:hypothetical protein